MQKAAETGVDDAAGYLVPESYAQGLFDMALEREIVRPRASIYRIKHGELNIVGRKITDHDSSLGGVKAAWGDEGEDLTEQTPRYRKMKLIAKKLGVYTEATEEMVEDAGVSGSQGARESADQALKNL